MATERLRPGQEPERKDEPGSYPGTSRRWMRDPESPEVRFPDSGWGREGSTRNTEERSSRASEHHHAGYSDQRPREDRRFSPRESGPRDSGRRHSGRDRFDPFGAGHGERADPGARDFRDYGRGDYRAQRDRQAAGSDPRDLGPDWEQSRRSFRGVGPRGYTRSDERIHEAICERLTEDPRIDASDVSVEVAGGVVTLTGTVDSRGTKYLIEEIADECAGVQDLHNHVRVNRLTR